MPAGGRPAGTPNPGAFADLVLEDAARTNRRVNVTLQPDEMLALAARVKAMKTSASWYLAELLRRDLAGGEPLPSWWEPEVSQQMDLLDREAV